VATTRRRKHWIIPKGIVEPGMTPAADLHRRCWFTWDGAADFVREALA